MGMDWSNERYVRVYTRDTADWLALSWQARALLIFILRKVDRVGAIELGRHGSRGLAGLVGMPPDVVESCLQELLADGVIQLFGTSLLVRNFIDAQEASSSPAQRQREHRERKRDEIRGGLRADHRKSVVYFVQSEDGGHIKVGYTEDLAKRLENLRSARPDRLVVLGAFGAQLADERRLHEAMSANREKGEWFAATPAVVAAARAAALPDANCDTVLAAFHGSALVTGNETLRVTPCLAVPSRAKPDLLARDPAGTTPTSAPGTGSGPEGSLSRNGQEGAAKTPAHAPVPPAPQTLPTAQSGPRSACIGTTALLDLLATTDRVVFDTPKPGRYGPGAMGEGRCKDLIGLQRAIQAQEMDQEDAALLARWLKAGGWHFYGGGTKERPGKIPVGQFVSNLAKMLGDARAWQEDQKPVAHRGKTDEERHQEQLAHRKYMQEMAEYIEPGNTASALELKRLGYGLAPLPEGMDLKAHLAQVYHDAMVKAYGPDYRRYE